MTQEILHSLGYLIAITIIVFMYRRSINRHIKVVKQATELIEASNRNTHEVLKYCVADVLQKAVESQDYETAIRCKQVLDELMKCDNETKKTKN